jgi:hypothetical protein
MTPAHRWRDGTARLLRGLADRIAGPPRDKRVAAVRPLLTTQGTTPIRTLDVSGAPEHWVRLLREAGLAAPSPRDALSHPASSPSDAPSHPPGEPPAGIPETIFERTQQEGTQQEGWRLHLGFRRGTAQGDGTQRLPVSKVLISAAGAGSTEVQAPSPAVPSASMERPERPRTLNLPNALIVDNPRGVLMLRLPQSIGAPPTPQTSELPTQQEVQGPSQRSNSSAAVGRVETSATAKRTSAALSGSGPAETAHAVDAHRHKAAGAAPGNQVPGNQVPAPRLNVANPQPSATIPPHPRTPPGLPDATNTPSAEAHITRTTERTPSAPSAADWPELAPRPGPRLDLEVTARLESAVARAVRLNEEQLAV